MPTADLRLIATALTLTVACAPAETDGGDTDAPDTATSTFPSPPPEVQDDWIPVDRCPALAQYAGCTATAALGADATARTLAWTWNADGRLAAFEARYASDGRPSFRVEATWEDDLLVREEQAWPDRDGDGEEGRAVYTRTYDSRGMLWEETRVLDVSPDNRHVRSGTSNYRYERDDDGLIARRTGAADDASFRRPIYDGALSENGWAYSLLTSWSDGETEAIATGATRLRIGADPLFTRAWRREPFFRLTYDREALLDRGLPQHTAWQTYGDGGTSYDGTVTYRDDCQPAAWTLTDRDGETSETRTWRYDQAGRMVQTPDGAVLTYDCDG